MKTGDSSNLNLLPNQAKFQLERMQLKAKIRKIIIIVVITWLSVGLITLALNMAVDSVFKSEDRKYQQSLTTLRSMDKEITLSQLIKYRIKVLGEVLSERYEYSTAFENINNLFSPQASLDKFNMDEHRNYTIEISVKDEDTLNFVEDKVKRINNGEVEGVKKVNMKKAVVDGELWKVNMEVIIK
ncbi:hypothetical protein KBB92_03210 [Candidatus Shapirobacteria bacterium]|nr:hypothetical protein [Candidatus Shapirobacteria bacterium]